MLPSEFKVWLDRCIRDARIQGLSDEAIYLELLEQVRFMTTMQMIKTANKNNGG